MLTGQGKPLMIAVLAACAALAIAILALLGLAGARLGFSPAAVGRAVARLFPAETPRPEHVATTTTAAAAAGPALSADPGAWFRADDYPPEALRQGAQGTVRFAASFDADGRVETCTIVKSSGVAALDDATCRIVSERGRSTARAAAGEPPPAIEKNVKWVLGQ